jgi:hypothetical protein
MMTYEELKTARQEKFRPVAGCLPKPERTGYATTRPIVLQMTVGRENLTLLEAEALCAELTLAIFDARHR